MNLSLLLNTQTDNTLSQRGDLLPEPSWPSRVSSWPPKQHAARKDYDISGGNNHNTTPTTTHPSSSSPKRMALDFLLNDQQQQLQQSSSLSSPILPSIYQLQQPQRAQQTTTTTKTTTTTTTTRGVTICTTTLPNPLTTPTPFPIPLLPCPNVIAPSPQKGGLAGTTPTTTTLPRSLPPAQRGSTGKDRTQKPKKSRRRLKNEELFILESVFACNPTPDAFTKIKLSQILFLSPQQVSNWFQNKRSRVRKEQRIFGRAEVGSAVWPSVKEDEDEELMEDEVM